MNNIRILNIADLEAVNEIYNQAVDSKFSTAHTEPISMDERMDWFREHNTSSIALLEKFGFELWGNMPGIAEIDNKKYNHLYYGLHENK